MMFFDALEAVRDERTLLGHLPTVERAWQHLRLDGVLFCDGRPILYLKESRNVLTPGERIRLHRSFWNQGVANVLVLADPTSVYIYSALARPLRDDSAGEERALVETLTHAGYAQGMNAFFALLASGAYYSTDDHRACFQPRETVDAYLLDNLEALREELCQGPAALGVEVAHAFLGRLLFACYLLDRKIVSLNGGQTPPQVTGAAQLEALLGRSRTFQEQREALYNWFAELKEQFNGTMFDQDLAAERAALRAAHMQAVFHFLGGHEVRSGQRTLGFWAYDFQMIPIETISAIYESFLASEDPQAKREGGAFYTPRFLAEMVLDVASEGVMDITSKRCLDPACGSGIFLVTLFSRMASAWLVKQSGHPTYAARVKAFQRILREQIQGIDINETACRIACFSLYLAYLDRLAPPDIAEHARRTGKALPRLMTGPSDGGSSSGDLIPVVRRADALAHAPDLNGTFDVVVGNPPWRERRDRLAQRFVEKAPDFLRPGGTGCLLLPTALLLNKTDVFQARWLRRITLERVVNLADYSFLLFTAKRPALIARFRNEPPRLGTATIEHDAPKFRRDSLREGCITISPQDRSWIPLRNILAAARDKNAPLLWKRYLWGTPRDQKLLDLLLDMPMLGEVAGSPEEKKRWFKGQGFQANTSGKNKQPKGAWWDPSHLFIPGRSASWSGGGLVLLKSDCEPIGQRCRSLHRPRDRRIYTPPMVLVSQGFEKVAFCDFPVLFQAALQSFVAPPSDVDLLLFLAVYLRSPLATYFLFHTAANWGTERDKVHLDELLRLPFPLPDSEFVSPKSQQIVQDVVKRVSAFRNRMEQLTCSCGHVLDSRLLDDRRQMTGALQSELNPMVYAYFGLTQQEVALVEDTSEVLIPSSTPHAWWSSDDVFTLDPVQKARPVTYKGGLSVYAVALTQTLNGWAAEAGSHHRVCATGGCDDATGLAMVTLHLAEEEAPFRQTDVSREIWRALDRYRRQAARQEHGALAGERDILLLNGDEIWIVRPGILANWTRTAALNDAARIYGDVVLATEGE
jgi:SAM-dependent methyltransferase